jgi:recombination protein RecT
MATVEQPPAKKMTLSEGVIDMVQKSSSYEGLLPAQYRPVADRMLKRAQLYIQTKPELHECTPISLMQCILQAGSNGHSLDGKMAHAVVFSCKKKDANGNDRWVKEAVYMPDYKGIVDVARRHGVIKDCYAKHVFANDLFEFGIVNGTQAMKHIPALLEEPGEYRGTYAVIIHEDGRIMLDWMNKVEIEAVRKKSKAANNGPWVTDWPEMAKKTVIRRNLKLYATDPELAALFDADDEAVGYDFAEAQNKIGDETKPRTIKQLTEKLAPKRLAEETKDPPTIEGTTELPDDTDQGPHIEDENQEAESPELTIEQMQDRFNECNSLGAVNQLMAEFTENCSPDDKVAIHDMAGEARKRVTKK